MTESPFLWGVSTASYQVEGGINTSAGPVNNWAPWDASGRVQPCGDALSFWACPERLLDLASATGCNAFRMSVEWARVQPAPGAWDPAALDRYAEILAMCRARGLEPVVTLQHFTHPLWAGQDLWLDHRAPDLFESYCRRCVDEIGRRLEAAGQPPVRWWITINEPAVVPAATYLLGMFPGTGWGPRRVAAAFDHTLAAHVRG
ncbi:MAG TPA: family 1 glycosylhydrolase, partial [Actinomycetota bacterium]|nr:family 1 glycosylhydrolase [Actinomycetota bacterium]